MSAAGLEAIIARDRRVSDILRLAAEGMISFDRAAELAGMAESPAPPKPIPNKRRQRAPSG